jgi:signal transduction histidine kinase
VPPNTVSIKGYVLSSARSDQDIPAEIKSLLPGRHNVEIKTIDYRTLVADRNGARYFLLFDTENEHAQESKFLHALIIFSIFVILASATGGFWLAVRVIAPLTRLSTQIGMAGYDTTMSPAKLVRNDEVGELARAFDRYQRRMREFIERERFFTADVSHELRTPLAITLGSLEVLGLDKSLTNKQGELLNRIRRAHQDMAELTAALLLLARENQTVVSYHLNHVGLIVQNCAKNYEYLLKGRPIAIELELVSEPNLLAEKVLFEIVVANLLRNALFSTLSGKIVLRLETDRLVVSDTGIGMSNELIAHAFERNFKGPDSAGAGVGLSLVKRICDRYGWLISINGQTGLGTTVEVLFSNPHSVTDDPASK